MSKYRLKTKEEFIRDGLWDEKCNCPDAWALDGEMNKYLGKDVPNEFNIRCDDNKSFKYDGWLFQNTDYVLKEQQEYFDDLSQHIGRYIRALVDYPHSGRVKKGEIGKIISNYDANFPSQQEYSCTNALSKRSLGIKYELLPEDYSPEQETTPEKKEPNVEFIPGKWYKLIDCENAYRKCSRIPVEDKLPYSEVIGSGGYRRETGSSVDLTRIKLLEDLSEIQEYLPDGHPNKIGSFNFEVGKWYKWYQKNHGDYNYGKVKETNLETDTLVMSPWIILCNDYKHSGTFDLSKAEQIQEISVEDIQEFLPKDHSDKISKSCINEVENLEFKKGEYIVITDEFDIISKDFISNHIYKQRCNSNFLQPEYDSLNSITNGWKRYTRNNTHNWRYATQEEIVEYNRRGKPYDVTELQKKELSMKEIQEECKKRFPIGCTYISTNGETHVLKKDSRTYTIVAQNVWAHSGAECLYKNGKWATLVSLPEENITEIPQYVECVSYFGDEYTGKIYNTTVDKPEKISTGTWYGILITYRRLEDGSFKISNKEAYEKQKSHIPEYIECTETREYYFIKGNIYKVIDSNNLASAKLVSNIDFCDLKAGTPLPCSMERNGKKYWNPSTKEKYDQQKPLTYESVSGCFPADKNIFINDEVRQYLSTAFDDYWKNLPTFVEKEFDIYGPTPDIE